MASKPQFEVLYGSDVWELEEKKTGVMVQVQKGVTLPVLVLAEMYYIPEREAYSFKGASKNGHGKTAVQIREEVTPEAIDFLIDELKKAKAHVEKRVKEVAKTETKKTVKEESTVETYKAVSPKKSKAKKEDDVEVVLEAKRFHKPVKRK